MKKFLSAITVITVITGILFMVIFAAVVIAYAAIVAGGW